MKDDWDQELKGKSVKGLHFTFSHPEARKHIRKKKLKAKGLRYDLSHSGVSLRKIVEAFKEKVNMA